MNYGQKNITAIANLLKKEYPQPKTALHFNTPLEILVSTILSAQCTDKRVNIVTKKLFKKYRSVKDYANAGLEAFEQKIRSTGFYKNKAKNIINTAKKIIKEFNAKVPESMEELIQLPGVARKTANIVLFNGFGKIEGIAVDTHVSRLSQRLNLSKNNTPKKIEYDLMKLLPKKEWGIFSNLLIAHGRKICKARRPKCTECLLKKLCPLRINQNNSNNKNSPFVLLETTRPDKENKNTFLFTDFVDILTFNHNDRVDLFFKKIESYLNKGYWLAGYFSYEFGYFLEPALFSLKEKNNTPLVWLGVCKKPSITNHQGHYNLASHGYKIKSIKPSITWTQYSSQIKKIKHYLEEGLTYQVNLTFKLKFNFQGDVLDFYQSLKSSQPTFYSGFINTGKANILSLSPELFFRINKNDITVRPMKGTVARGLTLDDDTRARKAMKTDEKTKAENLMIVDLLRNDLGRISEKVQVPKLFDVEKHRTLYQMTSTIKAKLKKDLPIKNIISSLFPCGSVTGAPKIKTMHIIKELEKEPRGIYTGAIGYISPKKEMCFSVAIRTIQIKGKEGELGIGGGIVYDSTERAEYDEALLKGKFFMQKVSKFCLIESILLNEEGFFMLDLHLKRLRSSCKYFSIPLNENTLNTKLKEIVVVNKKKLKVKVLINLAGKIQLSAESLDEIRTVVKVKVSSKKINPNDNFLYHKTTQRMLYDKERNKAKGEGFFETIFLNTHGQVTEGAISNIFILKDKKIYTPPLECGLLPGVLRQHLLTEGRVKEKILCLKDIHKADKVYIGNSVRGLLEAKISLSKGQRKGVEKPVKSKVLLTEKYL